MLHRISPLAGASLNGHRFGPLLRYKKAQACQQVDGQYAVVVDLVKHPNGSVSMKVFEKNLPSLHRAKNLASVLNLAR